MLDTGAWGLPVLFDGRIDLQKPPGYYWLVATLGKLNGGVVDEWAARVPAALGALVCVLLVYGFLRVDGRPTAAIVSALVLATANHFTAIARTARIDIPLTCAVTAALLAFARGCASSRQTAWHLVAALASAAAILLKGPVAVALIGPVALAWVLIERPRVSIASWVLIPLVVATASAPWFIWANAATDGEFVRVFFWHHTVARFTGSSPLLASYPWWYYAPRFAIDFLPWTPLLVGSLVWVLRSGQWRDDPHLRFGLIAFSIMFVVLSAARFKRADYLLPAYPFAAIVVGCTAQSWLESRTRARSARIAKHLFAVTLAAVVVGWVVMTTMIEPTEQAREEKRRFAAAIRSHAPAPHAILQFRMESHLLSFHLGRPLHTLVEWGDLNERLARPGPHFVVMPPEYVFAASQVITSRKLVEVARLEEYTEAKPPRPLVFLRTDD
jgi:4-amino-4-deoxy-L-arabinose transferase-like glycosyltransferase